MVACYLCRVVLSDNYRKRKRIKSCPIAVAVLKKICTENSGKLEMSDPNALFCSSCEQQLYHIHSYESKIAASKLTIKSYLLGHPKYSILAPRLALQATPIRQSPPERPSPKRPCAAPSPSVSPSIKVSINYPHGEKQYNVKTPTRKDAVKRIVRRKYTALVSSVVQSDTTCNKVLTEVARKVKQEMKLYSSDATDSLLQDTYEALKHFSWKTVYLEMRRHIPTLVSLLSDIIPFSDQKEPLLCMLAAQLLKTRHQRMNLVQRAVSVMLYGNGSSKQVYVSLQKLNVCLSYQGVLNIIDRICEDHDVEVHFWKDELEQKLLSHGDDRGNLPPQVRTGLPPEVAMVVMGDSYESDSESCIAPPFSPLSSESEFEWDDGVDEDQEGDIDEQREEESMTEQVQESLGKRTDEMDDEVTDEILETAESTWFGFKLVGDNVDKSTKASFQRAETHENTSFHHFHSYAAKDRLDLSNCLDKPPPVPDSIMADSILPTSSEISSIKKDFTVLLSRIIVEHMLEFSHQAKSILWHIPSKFTGEMSSRSEVIPLGVRLHDENKLSEMCLIMDAHHKYVPTCVAEGVATLPTGTTVSFDKTTFHDILFGGDQLTVARARGTKGLRHTEDSGVDRLDGLVPVIEDWHARQTLMKVIWRQLFSKESGKEKGTLYQLRNLIHRTNVPCDPENNMKSAEDFLLLVLHAHAIAAAEEIQSLVQVDHESPEDLAKLIVSNYVNLPFSEDHPASADRIYLYATEVLTLTLFWHGFHDATCEGDGERLLIYWKFLLIIFKASRRYNYAKEAVNLLLSHRFFFSERKVLQLLWSRTVNTKGRQGCNIPCDLHMEHLNRRLKTILCSKGSNITPSSIIKAGKSVYLVHKLCQGFEEETTTTSTPSGRHSQPKFLKDFKSVLGELKNEQVFTPLSARVHNSFEWKSSIFLKLSKKELTVMIKKNIDELV